MRTILIFLAFIFSLNSLFAQAECRPYLPGKEGASWEITNYSDKGKVAGKIRYKLLERTESGNEVHFKVEATTFNDKNEQTYTTTFTAKCVDSKFEFDMAFKLDGATMEKYQNMDVDIDASEFELPNMDQPAGTMLKDGNLKMAIAAGGPMNFNMTVFINNRKIEGKESITTPAGTFDCVVLSQDIDTKFILKVQASSKEWYAENIGMIRSESYNKKGKLMGYSELTLMEQ